MRDAKKLAVALMALVVATALVACGGGGDETTEEAEAETVSGKFVTFTGGPATDFQVFGKATLERADGGTTLTVNLSGLEPRTEYVAHLHTGSCDSADPGGPHFQFNKGGSEEPPNEIHLEFTSSAAGKATAKATSDREVPVGEAGSVVVHAAEGHSEMAASDPAEAETVTALFVHEGDEHGGKPHGEEQPRSDKAACAQLEGGSAAPDAGEGEAAGGPVPTVVVRGGEPVDGVQTLEFDAGEEIRFRVSSDAAEEIHVHGYDIAKDVPAGGSVEFAFPAEIEGIFEVELEELAVQIVELVVNP